MAYVVGQEGHPTVKVSIEGPWMVPAILKSHPSNQPSAPQWKGPISITESNSLGKSFHQGVK